MAPDLTGSETDFRFGYVTLVIAGSQRLVATPVSYNPLEVLRYLISNGAPVDSEDIAGLTALHHATMRLSTPVDLIRTLLECGANPNHQNRYGEVPVFGAYQANSIPAIDLLMEFGASLEIADADGVLPSKGFLACGPQVTAAVTKWLRRRNGEDALMEEKMCSNCQCKGTDIKLSFCGKCHVARYCSTECQRECLSSNFFFREPCSFPGSDWPTHKKSCRAFSTSNTVTLKPVYEQHGIASTANLVRSVLNIPTPPIHGRHDRTVHTLKSPQSTGKRIVIKVQVPFDYRSGSPVTDTVQDLLVYTKKRDFVCTIRRADDPAGYDKISEVVRSKGVGGAKAYFAAELKSKDVLIVKISDILAEQPF
jgi:hypothetical protein